MWEAGAFPDYPDMELIAGEIYDIPADGPRTIDWNEAVGHALHKALAGTDYRIIGDKTLNLGEDLGGPKPDYYIRHKSVPNAVLNGTTVLLVIEVSDTTVAFDRDVKAPLYEAAGVREHWRIECDARKIMVYRLGADGKCGEPAEVGFDETASALLLPLSLRLADLDLPA
jgi:hypothetical protein